VQAPPGAPGTNDHYVVVSYYDTLENTPEATGDNDSLATAEVVTLTPVDAPPTVDRHGVMARLPAGDVDHFAFDVPIGRTVTIFCGSRSRGSGLLGLTAELRSGADAVLASAAEMDPAPALIEAHTVPAPGRYYLRIASTGMDPEVTGDWVRCGIQTQP
jgi:hypothetical protein